MSINDWWRKLSPRVRSLAQIVALTIITLQVAQISEKRQGRKQRRKFNITLGSIPIYKIP